MADHPFTGTLSVTDKIGIGIGEPIAQLHIASSTSAPSQAFLESGGALLKLSVDASSAAIGTTNAFPLSIQTDGTPRISINQAGRVDISASLSVQNTLTISGNVGIGTSTPSQKLEVVGTVKATGFEGNGATLKGVVKAAGDTMTGALTINNNLTVNGNVGIGTASPAARLHIHSNDNDALKITNTALLKTARMGVDHLGVWIEPSETNSSIRLNANPSLFGLYVRGTDGNVGIGTTETSQKLTVASGHVQIDFGRVFGSNPNDKFGFDGKEMGHYSIGWFGDSWNLNGATAWLSGWAGIKLFTSGQPRLSIDNGGNVRYAVSFEKSSSRELKENINDLLTQEAVETLEVLTPVKYHLKADQEKNLHIGFIAEDVPDLIASLDHKAVSTDNIVAVLTKVVKEQQKSISGLVQKVKALENQK